MNLQSIALTGSSLGLLILTGCGSPTATAPATQPAAQPTASSPSQPIVSPTTSKQGGMVVESGPYHLELVQEKEGSNIHLDLFVQRGDNHETIPNAKVMAQIQLPDGSQKSIPMIYDASGKHYAGKLETVATGEYKVAVQSEINGEKVNTRYTFKQ